MLRRAIVLAALAGVLAAPAVANADAFDDVFADYQRDGRIAACDHSRADLRSAKRQVPNDVEQYAPDFRAALDEALEERARAQCPAARSTAGAATTTATPGDPATAGGGGGDAAAAPAGSVPQPPGSARPADAASDGAIVNAASRTADRGSDGIPAPLIALGVLGALLLLCLLAWGIARFFAWDPVWLANARHAVAEAGWRAGALWDDFTDWLRPGRRSA